MADWLDFIDRRANIYALRDYTVMNGRRDYGWTAILDTESLVITQPPHDLEALYKWDLEPDFPLRPATQMVEYIHNRLILTAKDACKSSVSADNFENRQTLDEMLARLDRAGDLNLHYQLARILYTLAQYPDEELSTLVKCVGPDPRDVDAWLAWEPGTASKPALNNSLLDYSRCRSAVRLLYNNWKKLATTEKENNRLRTFAARLLYLSFSAVICKNVAPAALRECISLIKRLRLLTINKNLQMVLAAAAVFEESEFETGSLFADCNEKLLELEQNNEPPAALRGATTPGEPSTVGTPSALAATASADPTATFPAASSAVAFSATTEASSDATPLALDAQSVFLPTEDNRGPSPVGLHLREA